MRGLTRPELARPLTQSDELAGNVEQTVYLGFQHERIDGRAVLRPLAQLLAGGEEDDLRLGRYFFEPRRNFEPGDVAFEEVVEDDQPCPGPACEFDRRLSIGGFAHDNEFR